MKKIFGLLFCLVLALSAVSAITLTVNSPINNKNYSFNNVTFNLNSTSVSNFYYATVSNISGPWKLICSKDCIKTVLFAEGEHNIKIKAVDSSSSAVDIKEVSFAVDSKKPIITKTTPLSGFANGTFGVQFKEQNLDSVVLHYGTSLNGYNESNVTKNCSMLVETKISCNATINLSAFNGQELGYWFEITDSAKNNANSSKAFLKVDTTPPVINSFENNTRGKAVDFVLEIIEQNFDSVKYIDYADRTPKWKVLCNSLENGQCIKSVNLVKGTHRINITVSDLAGNIAQPAGMPLNLTIA